MDRRAASVAFLLAPAFLCAADSAPAQEEAPAKQPEPSFEQRLEEIGRRVEQLLESVLADVGRSIEHHFDPAAAAEEARERFGLSPEQTERARALLAEVREFHLGERSCGERSSEERARFTDSLRERAVAALGEEHGRAFSEWAFERQLELGERLRQTLEPFGREIGHSARDFAARIVEKIVPRAEGEAARFALLAEKVAREAVEEVHRALTELDLDSIGWPGQESAPSSRPSRFRGRSASRPSLLPDREAIERAAREGYRAAEEARQAAERAVREALERASQEVPRMTREAQEAVRRALEQAMQEFQRMQQRGERGGEEAVRRAMEEAARHADAIAERARQTAGEGMEVLRSAGEAARRRAMELERAAAGRLRSQLESESGELRRAREELELLRRRVEELERKLGERTESRPARSPI